MIALDAGRHRRLIAAARLLSSNRDGERHAALEAVGRLLPDGVSLADVLERALVPSLSAPVIPVTPRPWHFRDEGDWMSPWRKTAKKLLNRHPDRFNERETSFLADMAVRRDQPSRKQEAWLSNLTARAAGGVQ